jgi:hypothetical protein
MRRIGVLMGGGENDPVEKTLISAFVQSLAGLGWTDGRNMRMDLRWGRTDSNRIPALGMSRFLLNIEKRSLSWLTLCGVSLASKNAM